MDGSSTRKNETLISAPIMADSVDLMLANLAKAKPCGADLVEIRLDALKTVSPQEDISALIKALHCPPCLRADEKGKFNEPVEDKVVKILIEPKALMHVSGTRMDFVDDKLRSEFIFINPNSKGQCGCG